MSRHGPHIISLIKGLLLFFAMLLFIRTGTSAELTATLENRLFGWSITVYPLYWIVVFLGGLLLAFPLTLAQDHLMRTAEGHHEETPTWFWLRGVAMELLFGAVIFSLFSGVLYFTPAYGWLILSVVWIGYHMLYPKAQAWMFSMGGHEDEESLTDLTVALKEPLARAGVSLLDVHPIDDDEETTSADKDILFVSSGHQKKLLVPREWASTWTTEEITAVTLHKVWMERPRSHAHEFLIHVANCGVAFGGFTLALPWLSRLLHVEDPHTLTVASMLAAWMIAALFVVRLCVLPFYRRWMCEADDFVAAQMGSPHALTAVLERAMKDMPADADIPRWAEWMFSSSISLKRRIDRLRNQSGAPA